MRTVHGDVTVACAADEQERNGDVVFSEVERHERLNDT